MYSYNETLVQWLQKRKVDKYAAVYFYRNVQELYPQFNYKSAVEFTDGVDRQFYHVADRPYVPRRPYDPNATPVPVLDTCARTVRLDKDIHFRAYGVEIWARTGYDGMTDTLYVLKDVYIQNDMPAYYAHQYIRRVIPQKPPYQCPRCGGTHLRQHGDGIPKWLVIHTAWVCQDCGHTAKKGEFTND